MLGGQGMESTAKNTLRSQLLARRKALSLHMVEEASATIVKRIQRLPQWSRVQQVLLYWPTHNEVDTRPLIHELWHRNVSVLLPRCHQKHPGVMDLACVQKEQDLRPGMFSIMEPCPTHCPPLEDVQPDIALIPGVAFDKTGYRLGFGGGYYDRLLETHALQKTLCIGLCYHFQWVEKITAEPWDKPVNMICSEEKLCQI